VSNRLGEALRRGGRRQMAARVRLAVWCRRWAIGAAVLVGFVSALDATAESPDSMRGLDQQVQGVKSDVLAIATELQQLEEKLLYPSNTQVAVFVSIEAGESLELDSVHVLVDGQPVAHHVYEWKELEALRKGGVQRLYTGNLTAGTHRLEVTLAGKLPGGLAFDETQGFDFHKEVEPKMIDLKLSGGMVGGVQIAFGDE